MLKAHPCNSSDLHLLAIKCNCRTYDIGLKSFWTYFQTYVMPPSRAYLGGLRYVGLGIKRGVFSIRPIYFIFKVNLLNEKFNYISMFLFTDFMPSYWICYNLINNQKLRIFSFSFRMLARWDMKAWTIQVLRKWGNVKSLRDKSVTWHMKYFFWGC